MKSFVITCNDSVEHVVLGGTQEDAERVLEELAREYFEQNEYEWKDRSERLWRGARQPYELYRMSVHWAVRDTCNSLGMSVIRSLAEEVDDFEPPPEGEFKKCTICDAKPGSLVLCEPCLHDRDLISRLQRYLTSLEIS